MAPGSATGAALTAVAADRAVRAKALANFMARRGEEALRIIRRMRSGWLGTTMETSRSPLKMEYIYLFCWRLQLCIGGEIRVEKSVCNRELSWCDGDGAGAGANGPVSRSLTRTSNGFIYECHLPSPEMPFESIVASHLRNTGRRE